MAPGIVRGVTPIYVAKHYIYAGDYDRAMDWIEESFEVHGPEMPGIAYDLFSILCAPTPASRTSSAG